MVECVLEVSIAVAEGQGGSEGSIKDAAIVSGCQGGSVSCRISQTKSEEKLAVGEASMGVCQLHHFQVPLSLVVEGSRITLVHEEVVCHRDGQTDLGVVDTLGRCTHVKGSTDFQARQLLQKALCQAHT